MLKITIEVIESDAVPELEYGESYITLELKEEYNLVTKGETTVSKIQDKLTKLRNFIHTL